MTVKKPWVSRWGLALGLGALVAAPAAAQDSSSYDLEASGQEAQPDNGSYGYLRVIDGSADVLQAGSAARTPADTNQPLMVGDHLWVPERSHVELVLADRNLVRLDGGSELLLEHLAASPDANDPTTVLRLLEGNLQIVVTQESLGDQLPRLETPNASILPQDFGVYRVTTDQGSWSELVVRRGKAVVETQDDSQVVNAAERLVVEGGDRHARLDVGAATGFDNLERWAQRLDADADVEVSGLDQDLQYQAAPLQRNGAWVSIEGDDYWRPNVAADWRPYSEGRWDYTPSGMTWVSYEPWGWVPYHYGSWDFFPDYGWVWRPGSVYAPAWVYWYWGPSYTGWCPIGYYTHYYGARFGLPGFHLGVYGWAGGEWGAFANWTFVPSRYFVGFRGGWTGRGEGWREHWNVRRQAVPVDQLRRGGPIARGIITTDTRALRPETVRDPQRVLRVLTDQPTARRVAGGGQLPDVTPFIARQAELTPQVRTAIATHGDVNRLTGTPLRPSTLGQAGRTAGPRVGARPRGAADRPSDATARNSGRGGAPRPESPAEPRPRAVPDRGGRQGGAARPDAHPAPAPRPDSHPTPRPESHPAPRPDAHAAPRPDSRPDSHPAPRPDSHPDSHPTPRPDSHPESHQAPRPDPHQESRPESHPDPKPHADPPARPAPEKDRTPPPSRMPAQG